MHNGAQYYLRCEGSIIALTGYDDRFLLASASSINERPFTTHRHHVVGLSGCLYPYAILHLVSYLLNVNLARLCWAALITSQGLLAATIFIFQFAVGVEKVQESPSRQLSQGGCAACILWIEPRHGLHAWRMLLLSSAMRCCAQRWTSSAVVHAQHTAVHSASLSRREVTFLTTAVMRRPCNFLPVRSWVKGPPFSGVRS